MTSCGRCQRSRGSGWAAAAMASRRINKMRRTKVPAGLRLMSLARVSADVIPGETSDGFFARLQTWIRKMARESTSRGGAYPAAGTCCRRLWRRLRGSRLRLSLGRHQAHGLAHLGLDPGGDVLVLLQELARVLTTLSDAFAFVAEPGAGLFHDVVIHREVQHVAFARDAFAVEDVELGLAERRRHLVLHHLDLGARADDHVAFLDRRDAPDIHAH